MTRWIDTMFVRGGTSKGLMFEAAALPGGLALPGDAAADPVALGERDAILCAALGSPDRFGRQLDGMGGGVSSLSKAVIVDRSERAGIDLDYTFAQVSVGEAAVDYAGNCGNLSSAVVPFALAAGLIVRGDGAQRFALWNTNTRKRVDVRLTVQNGYAAVQGGLAIPGVAGSGSPIELVYPDPGGSRTVGLRPTGRSLDELEVDGRTVRVSLVDATNPLVLVAAADVGVTGAELPVELDANSTAMRLLEQLRRAGAVRMGLCDDPEAAPLAVPKVVVIGPAAASRLLDGGELPVSDVDVLARTLSMGRTHNAIPGTAAMCLAAASEIFGSVVAEAKAATDAARPAGVLRIGTPSGAVTAGAVVAHSRTADPALNVPRAIETSLARTARILMRGSVAVETRSARAAD
jgi:2-methylaconitate cis-trans-isomerase PrpF